MPLVSVVMSVYNGEKFVAETIESVLNQTYSNIEVIIVDDCSKDGSRQIIEKYQKKDWRVRTILMDRNSNVCVACNRAFANATGKYVAVIGHDDIWGADKSEKQITFLEEHPDVGICLSG